jgi:RsiW-degrading membrane proteinase PrsW (M82 family)
LGIQTVLIASFSPGLFWLWFFFRQDRLRPEPKRLIALTFALGCLATFPAAILEGLFDLGGLLEGESDLIAVATGMLLVVGPVEELCKFSVVRLVAYRSLYFDEPMDGLVYGAAASLGFASLENLAYVLNYGPEVMYFRAPLSTVAHLVFGSIWGYALGRRHSSGGASGWLVIGGLSLAATAHSLFNVTVVFYPWAAALLVLVGEVWSFRRFRWGQRVSPFRYQRNYPFTQCRSCHALVRVLDRHCTSCGRLAPARGLELICGRCQAVNRPASSYCTGCGDRLLTR